MFQYPAGAEQKVNQIAVQLCIVYADDKPVGMSVETTQLRRAQIEFAALLVHVNQVPAGLLFQ